jgi:hypothetical protein
MYKWNTKYIVEDNFLTNEDFESCVKYYDVIKDTDGFTVDKFTRQQWQISKNKFFTNGKLSIQTDLATRIYNKYNSLMIKYLEDLAPEKLKLYEFSEVNFIRNGANNNFHIHYDSPGKLLSVVVYLYPKNNFGTFFYSNENGDDCYELEWKQNRALIFSRNDKTWHSYKSDSKGDRYTLVYNLRSCKNDKERMM